MHRAGRRCCIPTQTIKPSSTPPSPDGRSYRIDTYIIRHTPTQAALTAAQLKRVTVVVRRPSPLEDALARVTSNFDQSTG